MNKIFEQYKSQIIKNSNMFANKLQINAEEALSESYHAFLYAMRTWNKKYAFSKWLQTCIYFHLKRWKIESSQTNKQLPDYLTYSEKPDYMERFNNLSEESKQILQLCLNLPEELKPEQTGKRGRPRAIGQALKNHLRKNGWTLYQVNKSWKEIKSAM